MPFGQCANAEVEVFGTCIMDFDGNSEAVAHVIKASHEMCETTERTCGKRATLGYILVCVIQFGNILSTDSQTNRETSCKIYGPT